MSHCQNECPESQLDTYVAFDDEEDNKDLERGDDFKWEEIEVKEGKILVTHKALATLEIYYNEDWFYSNSFKTHYKPPEKCT